MSGTKPTFDELYGPWICAGCGNPHRLGDPCPGDHNESTPGPVAYQIFDLESRVAAWVRTRIGEAHMDRRERAMRLLEEALELAQAEQITVEQVCAQFIHAYRRPAGEPSQEAAGVAVCLLGWCAATGNRFEDLATREIERIEAKPVEQIRGSVARKADAGVVTVVEDQP